MEQHNLMDRLFGLVNVYLAENGLNVNRGTIVDASIIDAPGSTKNRKKERVLEMQSTRKGRQWHFGMKAHIGVDSGSKLNNSVVATPANAPDSQVLPDLLYGNETRVWGDSAYTGQKAVLSEAASATREFTQAKRSRYSKLDTRGTIEELHEDPGTGEGEISVRMYEGAIPRSVEECSSAVCGLCAEQPGDGETGSFETKSAETAGYVRLKNGNSGITPAFSGSQPLIPDISTILIY